MARGVKTGGRQVGTPNKLTKEIKDAFAEAFEILQRDPDCNLVAWAKQNTTVFYQLSSKLIPLKSDLTLRQNELLTEEQTRLMAEEFLLSRAGGAPSSVEGR